MKTIIILIVFSTGLMFTQTVDSSQIKKVNQEQNQIKNQEQGKNQLKNQIGPKENPQGKGHIERKRKDVFIDKDGDGICDSRQSGMSFNKMRKRMGAGKKGPGNGGSGSGGNQNGGGHNGGK
jgi:hypothetical protein